jgi:hypothetical protein
MNASNIIYLVKCIPRLLFFSKNRVLHSRGRDLSGLPIKKPDEGDPVNKMDVGDQG